MKTLNILIFLLMIVVGISACAGTQISGEKNSALNIRNSASIDVSPVRNSFGTINNPTVPSGLTMEQHSKIIKDYFDADPDRLLKHGKRLRFISLAESWQQAHGAAQQYMSEITNTPVSSYIQEQIAVNMLRTFFLDIETSPEVAQAITSYMDLLLKNGYYSEPNLYAQILHKLQGYWTKDKIQSVSQKTFQVNQWSRGTQISQKKYFSELAKASRNNSDVQNSTKSEDEIAQELKEKFKGNIPQKLNDLRMLLNEKEGIEKWFASKNESLIILSIIGEN